jgi:glucose uptake protein GlcU
VLQFGCGADILACQSAQVARSLLHMRTAETPCYQALGLLGGAIWGVGTVFNFVTANYVGVAISYAIGQASPMIAALWGVLVWHEFRRASARAKGYWRVCSCLIFLELYLIARAFLTKVRKSGCSHPGANAPETMLPS